MPKFLIDKDGTKYDASALTQSELMEAYKDGMVDEGTSEARPKLTRGGPGPVQRAVLGYGGNMLDTAKSIGSAVMHPLDTLSNIGQSVNQDMAAYGEEPTVVNRARASLRAGARALNPLNVVTPVTDKLREGDYAGAGGVGLAELVKAVGMKRALDTVAPAAKRVIPGQKTLGPAAAELRDAVRPLAGENVTDLDLRRALQSVRNYSGTENPPTDMASFTSRLRAKAAQVRATSSMPSYADSLDAVADSMERRMSELGGHASPMQAGSGAYYVGKGMASGNPVYAAYGASKFAKSIPRVLASQKVATAARMAAGGPKSRTLAAMAKGGRGIVAAVPINSMNDPSASHDNKGD